MNLVKHEDGYIKFAFVDQNGERVWHYDLPEQVVSSRRKLISQIYLLSEKSGWVTAQHIREFVEIAHKIAGNNPRTGV